ncbi:MAG: ribosome maturation factor RimP [Clostridiales bacterium]|nr:ribosome maturation factor RimP [Clostridiales bacterium]
MNRGITLADRLVDTIEEGTGRILQEIGLSLVDLELVKEGANWYLRYFIEHLSLDEQVSIDDCQKASELLSDWLDEHDPIPQAYFLEVSSPGIERPIKKEADFLRFQGSLVQVNTYKPVHGGKAHVGRLGPVTEAVLTLWQKEEEMTIDREMISGVHLYWEDSEEE